MKSTRRVLSALVTFGLLCPAIMHAACPAPGQIKSKMDLLDKGACLRGANLWQKRGGSTTSPPYTQANLDELASWGANYLNLSIPGPFTEKAPYQWDAGIAASMVDLIKKAEKANLFVIVSFRTGPGRNESVFGGESAPKLNAVWSSQTARDAWVAMWKQTAQLLKGYDNVVAYDLMVEPEKPVHAMWSQMAKDITVAIRAVDTETPIVVPGADWDTYLSLPDITPTGDSKTVYAVHQYSPYEYTHSLSTAQPTFSAMQQIFDAITKFEKSSGAQVIVNEFGIRYDNKTAAAFLQDEFNLLEAIGAGNALWLWESKQHSYQGEFTIYNAPAGVAKTIKDYWAKNTAFPSTVAALGGQAPTPTPTPTPVPTPTPPANLCGNGKVDAGEACDDGGSNGSYGACKTDCSGAGPKCGDGVVQSVEQCDDGNASNTDACLNTCKAATCGDGKVQKGAEQCDDGNEINTDGCLSSCITAICGDGKVDPGEACDDGGSNGNTGMCKTDCSGVGAKCGDGIVQGSEQCDDGNGSNSDACLNTCEQATCGDGKVQKGVEQCDDGNNDSGDGCLANCQVATCGDGVVQSGVEQCDDGNKDDTDGCLSTCKTADKRVAETGSGDAGAGGAGSGDAGSGDAGSGDGPTVDASLAAKIARLKHSAARLQAKAKAAVAKAKLLMSKRRASRTKIGWLLAKAKRLSLRAAILAEKAAKLEAAASEEAPAGRAGAGRG